MARGFGFFSFCALLLNFAGFSFGDEIPEYACPRISGRITIDGQMTESSWHHAPIIRFRQIADGTIPDRGCGAKMLWDDAHLYVGIFAEDPKITGVYTGDIVMEGTGDERHFVDAIMMNDSFFKVFLDPDGDGKKYMEFHLNSLNVLNDIYLNTGSTRTDRQNISLDPQNYHDTWHLPGLLHAVHIRGTLNYNEDMDDGWSAEFAFPWESLKPFFAGEYPPATGTLLRAHLGWVERDMPQGSRQYWTWPVIGIVDCHQLHRWGKINFSAEKAQ